MIRRTSRTRCVEFADHRLRRDRQDPRRLGDGRDRRQGQYRCSSCPTRCRRPCRWSTSFKKELRRVLPELQDRAGDQCRRDRMGAPRSSRRSSRRVQAHPEINVVIPIYDSMSQFVVPALRLAGKTGQVKVGDLQRHALRARLHPAGHGRHGYRREPRLDRLCDRRRPPARPLRPEVADGAQRAVLHLRQDQRRRGRARRPVTTRAMATPISPASTSYGSCSKPTT